MRRARAWLPALALLLLPLSPLACDDDDDDGPGPDGSATKEAAAGDGALPWPDLPLFKDAKPSACTPGAANMCGGDKNFHCSSGTCARCPDNYVDCDRKDKCECFGACDGNKCVKGGG